MLSCGRWSRRCRAWLWKRPFPGPRNLISHPLQDPNLSLSRVWETNEHYPPSARLSAFQHTHTQTHARTHARTHAHTHTLTALRFMSLLDTMFISAAMRVCDAYQCLVVNLLPDEFVLTEGVSGFSGDGVYWAFFHLLFYSTVQHEERLTCTLL